MKPYFEEDGIVIYHGDCREVLPNLPVADSVFADPPYGVGKAEWDARYWSEWMPLAAEKAALSMGVTPGIANLPLLPFSVGSLVYRWMMSLRILNGCGRGAIGFGNWIACAVYARPQVGIGSSAQDCTEIVLTPPMPDHPSPKPYPAMLWITDRLPGDSLIDPFCGSGTTLLAAKNRGKKAIGIELEEQHCETAAKRLSQQVLNFSPPPTPSTRESGQ